MTKFTKKVSALIMSGLLFVPLICGFTAGGTHFPLRLFATTGESYSCYGSIRIESSTSEQGENVYVITHIGSNTTDVLIPAEINGIPVESISSDAFKDCKDNLTSITIDGSINIEEGTFNNCPNVLDVTFTGDMTELNYGHIFENTEIGTMTIPASVTYVNPETFYCITDTTTLVYEGSFENFWGTNGSDGIFGSLWTAYCKTREIQTGSMPTNIVINGKTYTATSLESNVIHYYNSKNKDAFGHKNSGYYKNNRNI